MGLLFPIQDWSSLRPFPILSLKAGSNRVCLNTTTAGRYFISDLCVLADRHHGFVAIHFCCSHHRLRLWKTSVTSVGYERWVCDRLCSTCCRREAVKQLITALEGRQQPFAFSVRQQILEMFYFMSLQDHRRTMFTCRQHFPNLLYRLS